MRHGHKMGPISQFIESYNLESSKYVTNYILIHFVLSGYDMGVVLMQRGYKLCYHFEMFHGCILNYHTYDKELINSLFQAIEKWKNYV